MDFFPLSFPHSFPPTRPSSTERMEDSGQMTGAGELGDTGKEAGTRAYGVEREGAREEATEEGEVGNQAMEEIGEVALDRKSVV